jgi:hypothetical protein
LTIKGHDIEVVRSFKYLGNRWNRENYNLYRDMNIVDDIKIRRRGWVGHIIRMAGERIPKKFLNWKLRNTRPVGKPRTRREDVVRRDTSQNLGMTGWRRRAKDREE